MAWSEFYGKVQGRAGEAARCGNKDSGLQMVAASKTGAIRVKMWHSNGVNHFSVRITDWGYPEFDDIPLAEGTFPVDEGEPVVRVGDEVTRKHVEREALRAMTKED